MQELFALLPGDPGPPFTEDYLDRVIARGRRAVRRRRIGAAAAGTAVLLVFVAIVLPGVPPRVRPAPPTHPGRHTAATVPDRFAGYSVFTSTVQRSAPGRAVALYGYGSGALLTMFQQLVVGADADTYRRIDDWDRRGRPAGLLAPDGTRVLLGDDAGPTPDLLLVDLTTGRERSVPLGGALEVRLLAWSPDGRYVAYSATTRDPAPGDGGTVGYDVQQGGTLRLLDLSTGDSREFASVRRPSAAAFAPDSARVAVQEAQRVHLLQLDGHEDRVVTVAPGRGLAPRVGWSVDGRLLATVPWDGTASDDGTVLGVAVSGGDVGFVALTPGAPPPPAPAADVVRVLGWRDADHLVVAVAPGGHELELAEVALASGERRVLSRFDPGLSCELGMQHCEILDLQLATGLVPELTVRPAGSPDRGPWPWSLRMLVAALIAAALLFALYLSRRRAAVRAADLEADLRRRGGGGGPALGPYR
ncbi:hypothetical protein Dvina_35315 [Dactylosporangium vinaceum]|uniref:WD40 repeat domain-containing protein n=1 Tax=Dactylosporangium vinaceum TaxID=53362 RepID=A0ABV5M418_9ACTN|nr:hypothetical protein [Dactylosporangium vinaceum]UAB93495.1 hypothetical protein Dvina_35315 [Dactylosporangium vinaceum]